MLGTNKVPGIAVRALWNGLFGATVGIPGRLCSFPPRTMRSSAHVPRNPPWAKCRASTRKSAAARGTASCPNRRWLRLYLSPTPPGQRSYGRPISGSSRRQTTELRSGWCGLHGAIIALRGQLCLRPGPCRSHLYLTTALHAFLFFLCFSRQSCRLESPQSR